MTRTAPSRPSVGSGRKLAGTNDIKPFRDNESSEPYYDPRWDNPYQRESTPANEDPKRKADRERQQRIDEKNWDDLTKQKKQEDFNLDLTGQVGFSHEIAEIGKDSISLTVGVDFLPGPDIKVKDGKASVGVGVGLPLVGNVNGGLVIDLDKKQVTGISGGIELLGIGIDFSTEKCHTTVTISIGGVGITYGKNTCKPEPEPPPTEPPPTEPPPTEPPPIPDPLPPPGGGSSGTISVPDQGYGLYIFSTFSSEYDYVTSLFAGNSYYSRSVLAMQGGGRNKDGNYVFQTSISSTNIEQNRPWKNWNTFYPMEIVYNKSEIVEATQINPGGKYFPYLGLSSEYPNAMIHKEGKAYKINLPLGTIGGTVIIIRGTGQQINQNLLKYINPNFSENIIWNSNMSYNPWLGFPASSLEQYYIRFVHTGFRPLPEKPINTIFPSPLLITPKKPEMCDLAPLMSLQRKNNEMMTQSLDLVKNSAAAIGVGAFPATYPGSLTTNKGTKKVNNLAEQVDTIYDTIDELMGKYPQKHKVRRKNKDGKDEEMEFEVPNQSEGQAELIGMMMQSLSQTTMSNNMENRQLQELALTRQMVVKLYYMVESIMEYLDYPTETTVVNVPMSITPMKRKGRSIEKLKEFGDMVKESIQPVIVTKKKSGDPETLKKYLLHLSHGAAVIKAAFWRKLSPENPKEQINANLAQQEKLSELSSTEKAWNEALESMAGKLDPQNEAEAKKNAPKIEVEKKKPGAK